MKWNRKGAGLVGSQESKWKPDRLRTGMLLLPRLVVQPDVIGGLRLIGRQYFLGDWFTASLHVPFTSRELAKGHNL